MTKIVPSSIIFQLRDLSIQSPLRKKLNLTISISLTTQKPVLSLSKSNDDVPELVISDLSSKNIRFATFLPSHEKKNFLYLVIYYNALSQSNNITGNDPIVLMMNKDAAAKQLIADKVIKESDDLITFIVRQTAISGLKITETFTLPHHNSFYVQAHRGIKEGLLYFLPHHILFGFKKPILLFPSEDVESISYSSITRITFCATIALKSGETFEFSMIDQEEFAKIDDYVKNRAVNDMSMSEQYKAKPTGAKTQQAEGILEEATQSLEVDGVQMDHQMVVNEDDSDEDDGDYRVEKEVDDTSDISGSESDDDGNEEVQENEDDDANDEDITGSDSLEAEEEDVDEAEESD
ncbi:hypothetical protein BON22_1869 [Cyberlindnera fabianii]|nr:hypothetical protein BON22_1869 [Cyberlindnera fabianii]